ncbi:hypothetical protein GCM10025857_08000 [Alicyclobacillus contaminans]|nr:hypothetical protein GCM10025857_08000 [Alicyclobacillus contaminans]
MEKMPLLPDNAYLPDLSAIPASVRGAAKLMFLNYPNNPTGATATSTFFEDVVRFADQHGVLVIHDFAYGAIGFDGVKPPSFLQTPGAKAIGVEIYTMSKTFNMAGWRIAFLVGNEEVVRAVNQFQDHYYVSLFAAVQRAAIAALTGPQQCVTDLVRMYERRRDAFVGALREHGVVCPSPGGSFFVWMPVPQGFSATTFAEFLLTEANVAVAPGVGFGEHGEGYVRVGLLTTEDRLREAALRIAGAVRVHS